MSDKPISSSQMEAGRSLDALVAEEVMGFVWVVVNDSSPVKPINRGLRPAPGVSSRYRPAFVIDMALPVCDLEYDDDLPYYSTDISAAWAVVEKLAQPGFHISVFIGGSGVIDVSVSALDYDAPDTGPIYQCIAEECDAETFPLAVCRAALQAAAVRTTGERP